jgi:osmotically-inducible protein OsmY
MVPIGWRSDLSSKEERKHMRKIHICGLIAAAALLSACQRNSDNSASGGSSDNQNQSSGRVTSSEKTPGQYDANNSGRNVRDRSGDTLTSEDQGGSPADREITRQVRRALTAKDQLSLDAKNIKVITVNGKVTLRGPVDSPEEQKSVAALVQGVSGVTSVDNQLEVKAK